VKTITPLDFSNVIAFLLPGFVAFYSLIYISPRASEIIEVSFSKESNMGILFVLVLFSLAAGLILSAFRSLILDWIQFKTGVDSPDLDHSKLKNKDTLTAYNEAINNTYRFSQFSGNMLIALILLLAGKLFTYSGSSNQYLVYFILVITIIVLFLSHRYALKDTYVTLAKILS